MYAGTSGTAAATHLEPGMLDHILHLVPILGVGDQHPAQQVSGERALCLARQLDQPLDGVLDEPDHLWQSVRQAGMRSAPSRTLCGNHAM